MSALDIVQIQFDAYNAQDMEAMLATYAEDCIIADLNGAITQRGRGELKARYGAMFAQYPQNRARSVNRMALGDCVIDHEEVSRAPEGPFFEAICVYTIKNGLIARVDFIK